MTLLEQNQRNAAIVPPAPPQAPTMMPTNQYQQLMQMMQQQMNQPPPTNHQLTNQIRTTIPKTGEVLINGRRIENDLVNGQRTVRRYPSSSIYCSRCGYDLSPNHFNRCKNVNAPGVTVTNRGPSGSENNVFHYFKENGMPFTMPKKKIM